MRNPDLCFLELDDFARQPTLLRPVLSDGADQALVGDGLCAAAIPLPLPLPLPNSPIESAEYCSRERPANHGTYAARCSECTL